MMPAVDLGASAVTFGPVTLVPGERALLKDGRPVALPPKAFDLLAYLAANPGRLLTKAELMREVWPDTVVEESNLASNVFAIRKALGESADGERYIETVPKRGYRFIAPVSPLPSGVQSRLEPPVAAASATTDRRGPSVPHKSLLLVGRWMYVAAGVAVGALAVTMLPASPTQNATHLPSYFQESAWDRHEGTGVGTLYPFHITRPLVAVSPDGRHFAIAMAGADGVTRLWIRTLNERVPTRPLVGTEAAFFYPFFWSPDSSSIAFDATGAGGLRMVNLVGGAPQRVCDLGAPVVGGSWNRSGVMIVGQAYGVIMQCPAAGGAATPVTSVAAGDPEAHLFPSFLPDGRHFIYLSISRRTPERTGIYVAELNNPSPVPAKRLLTTGFAATYVAAIDSGPGFLVFARDGALIAQRFDEQKLQPVGEPISLADRVGTFLDGADFSASPTTLLYRAPAAPLQLTWFDRDGRDVESVGAPEHMTAFDLSPDGARAIVARHAPLNTVDQDLWLYDARRDANPRRLTTSPMLEWSPRWAASDRFVFTSEEGEPGLYSQTVSGDRDLLMTGRPWPVTSSVSGDGRVILYSQLHDPKTGVDVWVHAVRGDQADDVPLLTGPGNQEQAQIAPDGRWVAYVSNESGSNEVFIAESRLDSATHRFMVGESVTLSKGGGFAPRWRSDGRELFYRTADGSVMSINITEGRGFPPADAKRLFAVPGALPDWGVAPDGRRFLFAMPTSDPRPYQIVLDWQAAIPK